MPRLSFSILLFVSVFTLPWWISFLFLLTLICYFPWYYEGVVAVLLYELLYSLSGSSPWLTISALLLVPIIEWLKTRLYVFH
ncbi:MAG: hypothetical protein WCV68_01300 [Candidatus Paceibacterota bacterium]|jgi:hypothetical protein